MPACNPEHLAAFLSALDTQSASYEVDGQVVSIHFPEWSGAPVVQIELSSVGEYLIATWVEHIAGEVREKREYTTMFDQDTINVDVPSVYQDVWYP